MSNKTLSQQDITSKNGRMLQIQHIVYVQTLTLSFDHLIVLNHSVSRLGTKVVDFE